MTKTKKKIPNKVSRGYIPQFLGAYTGVSYYPNDSTYNNTVLRVLQAIVREHGSYHKGYSYCHEYKEGAGLRRFRVTKMPYKIHPERGVVPQPHLEEQVEDTGWVLLEHETEWKDRLENILMYTANALMEKSEIRSQFERVLG